MRRKILQLVIAVWLSAVSDRERSRHRPRLMLPRKRALHQRRHKLQPRCPHRLLRNCPQPDRRCG